MKCNEGGYILINELNIPIVAGAPRKYAVKLLVKDRILGEPAKGEGDGRRRRLERKRPLWVQPLILTANSNQGFSWYGTALQCPIGNHIREWVHIRRSVADFIQSCVEVLSNRVLRYWNFVHDPSILLTILGTWSILRNRLENFTEEGDTGDTETYVVKRQEWGRCG